MLNLLAIGLAGLSLVKGTDIDVKSFGYGAQRLQHQHRLKHKLQTPTTCENVEEFRYKEAVIDNFAPIESQQYWEGEGQRYWLNKQFWSGEGGNIFVFIGGEGQESCSRLTSRMYVYELAKEHRALLVNVEHRFYGDSYPTTTMSTDNLQYLSSQQALADLARIITYIKSSLNTKGSRVVVVGGSYPGNMAAWFRLLYPHITVGAIASSAPLTAETNFYGYMEVVADSIESMAAAGTGAACNAALEAAAVTVSELLETASGMQQLSNDFKTCAPLNSTADASIFLSDLMGNIQGTVQYNNEHNGVMNITDICAVMVDATDKENTHAYSRFVTLSSMYRDMNGVACEDASWADTVAYLSAEEKDPNNNARPWTYQTCNEFGYFQTTDSKDQPFWSWKLLGMPFYRALCYAAFDNWKHEPQVDWMNTVYGDVHVAGTNTIFPSGTIDPWHYLGVTPTTPALVPSNIGVYIVGTAHCNDLYAAAPSDPETLTFARETIATIVRGWFA